MKVALFGAKGIVGSRILNEALSRGHTVTVVVRDPASYTAPEGVKVVAGDTSDPQSVGQVVVGHDAVISSVGPGRNDNPQPQNIPQAARSLLEALPTTGVKRLLVVGGAGSLEVAPGLQLVDSPQFPEQFKPEASAARDALNIVRESGANLDWTFFSPSLMIEPGERTGQFRVGGDQLLFDASGQSRISCEDFAVAVVDELEKGENIQRRVTVGY
jgi:uncharacterized protein